MNTPFWYKSSISFENFCKYYTWHPDSEYLCQWAIKYFDEETITVVPRSFHKPCNCTIIAVLVECNYLTGVCHSKEEIVKKVYANWLIGNKQEN